MTVIICDFCEKRQSEVEKLVSAKKDLHICSDCIKLCYRVITETQENVQGGE